jgi:hypothetical protein
MTIMTGLPSLSLALQHVGRSIGFLQDTPSEAPAIGQDQPSWRTTV